MATNLENVIDLPLLDYYDENIKRYIANKINKTLDNIVFTTKNALPVEGKVGTLYVTEESILIYNGTRWVEVGNPQTTSQATTWGKF